MDRTLLTDKTTIVEEIRKTVSEGRCISINVSGNSMNPLLVHQRDQITLGPWNDRDIRKGAVVLAKDTKGDYIIHRIVSRTDGRIVLMGDGNLHLTETACINEVIALMYSITRKGKVLTADSRKWRAYSWIWQRLTPIRRLPLGIWRRVNKNKVFDFSKTSFR